MDLRKASPGTISHGTLRTDDLLESFSSELTHQISRNTWTTPDETAERDRLLLIAGAARDCIGKDDPEGVTPEHIDGLIDALQAFAPEGHYFGTHEGDGSDFGYWPCDDFPDGSARRHCCC